MREQTPKRAILVALQNEPDFSQLIVLSKLTVGETHKLIRWLDQSGLALLFLHQLQSNAIARLVPAEFHLALVERHERNIQRLSGMQNEFRRIYKAFQAREVF